MEVVKTGLGVVDIASVAQRIVCTQGGCQGAGGGQGVAPGIVGIGDNDVAGAVGDTDHITLDVGNVVIVAAVPADGQRCALCVIGESKGLVAVLAGGYHLHQLAAVIDILPGGCAAVFRTGALGAHSVGIIGKVPGSDVAVFCAKSQDFSVAFEN